MIEVQTAARELGVDIVHAGFEQAADIAPAFDALTSRVDTLYVVAEPLAFVNRTEICNLALAAKLPTIYSVREYVDAGGLASYGPNFADLFRRSADFVDKDSKLRQPSYSERGASALSAPTTFSLADDARNDATVRTKVGPDSRTEAG
jgi:putative ABC transport system substrate-binding protein